MRGKWLKNFQNPAASNSQFFGQDARFSGDGHEIRIANPSRHNVKMKMFANAGARAMTEIHAHIEPFGVVQLLQRTNAALSENHHFGDLFRKRFLEARSVGVRRHHEVAGRVGKEIQDYEIVAAPIDDKPVCIPRRVLANAKDA